MLLRHARFLIAIVEQGSFTRAALALHISQPALSQQIRQLEERMGVALLDRSARRVRATDAGAAFIAHAQRAIGELEAGRRAVRDVADLSRGAVRVGFTPSFGAYFVAPLVRRFRDRHPGIMLNMVELAQENIEAELGADTLDLGIGFSAVQADDIDWQPLHAECLSLVVARDHPIAGKATIEAACLARQEFALLARSFATRTSIDAYLKRLALRPRIVLEANSIAIIVEIVRKSSLVTILPGVIAAAHHSLCAVELASPMDTRRVALLTRRGAYQSAAARAFAALIGDYSAELGAAI